MAKATVKECKKCGQMSALSNFVGGFDNDNKDYWCTNCRTSFCTSADKLKEYCNNNYRPFNLDLWNKCIVKAEGDDKKAISFYFKQMNMPQNKGKKIKKKKEPETEEVINKKSLKFWGTINNCTQEDYATLDSKYKEWTSRYKCDTPGEELLYKQICLQELQVQKVRETGKGDLKKEIDALTSLMAAAGVKPVDVNAANDPSNMDVLGLIIKDIETTRPAEYFADKKMFEDYDGIKEYAERFIFRPLKNLLTGSRDFDKEFNLDD